MFHRNTQKSSRQYVIWLSGGRSIRWVLCITIAFMMGVGGLVLSVISAQAAPLAYVTNEGSDPRLGPNDGRVFVVDTATNTVLDVITTGVQPTGVVVHPSGTRVYVANNNSADGTIAVIDTTTIPHTVVATIPVGTELGMMAIHPSGSHLYVGAADARVLWFFNTTTNTVDGGVPVGNSTAGVAVHPSGSRVYVTNFGSNTLSVIDTAGRFTIATVPVGNGPAGLVATPDGEEIYVAHGVSNDIWVIDTTTNTVIGTPIPVGRNPHHLTITPDGAYIYVTNFDDNTVSVINTTTKTVVGTPIPVNNGPAGIALTPDGQRVYVVNNLSNNLSVIDTTTNTVIGAPLLVGNRPGFIGISLDRETIASLGPAKLWIGLKNSDDQNTQFDLRVELYLNDSLVSEGLTRCITGVTRNPSTAVEVTVTFGAITHGAPKSGDILSLKVLTRIGTNPNDTKCPGHNNAVGLRLYFDAMSHPSRFAAEITPDPLAALFLHSNGTDFLDDMPPSATTAKFKDSSSLNFSGDNPWKAIGTWSITLPL